MHLVPLQLTADSIDSECVGGVDRLKPSDDPVDLFHMIGKSSQVDALSRMLQQAELRHQVTSQNIANLNTPGYKSLELSFVPGMPEDGAAGSLPQPIVEESTGLSAREDGNNVDLDRELGSLTKNSIEFETYSHLLLARLSLIRSAIIGQ